MTDNRLPSALPNSVLQSFLKKGFGGIDYPLERPFKQKVFRWIATLNSKLSPIFFFKVFSLFTTLEIFENLFFQGRQSWRACRLNVRYNLNPLLSLQAWLNIENFI